MIETISFKNKKMKYFKFGKGNKIIIMIPGLSIKSVMESESIIIDEYKILANDFQIYCFDRIDNPTNNYSIKDMALDMIDALNILNIDNVYLLGASQGGMISLEMALINPSIIKKIVIASTTPNVDEEMNNKIKEFINYAINNKINDLVHSFSKIIYPKDIYNKYFDYLNDLSKTITKNEIDKFIIFAQSLLKFNILDDINKINLPILEFHDKLDELINVEIIDTVKEVMKNNSNYKYYIYNGYGHALYDLAPDFKNIVSDYFNK